MRQISTFFENLTGNAPFPWQQEWYRHLAAGDFDAIKSCSLPTGLGKTMVMALWLIALANDKKNIVPRRLVYVVNRRTVVDQASDEAAKLKRIVDDDETMKEKLGGLEVSTLRGELAETNDWWRNPGKPAIVVGTVDLIGSRLLFRGYRAGYKRQPLFAGFLGQDTLLVHDEAHLEPAFQTLLTEIKKEQSNSSDRKNFHVVELTATSSTGEDPFGLSDADLEHPVVQDRIRARKKLVLHEIDDDKQLNRKLAELALEHRESDKAILIFAQRVETISNVARLLTAAKIPSERIRRLTGILRGQERDSLVETPVFQRFLPPSSRSESSTLQDGTVYLLCTSAGEVGVNISADHLVCDLTPFDSMAQRFGRVNRFGGKDDNGRLRAANVDVVHPAAFEKDEKKRNEPWYQFTVARELTLGLLQRLGGDASPSAISTLLNKLSIDQRLAAFSPKPEIAPVSDILFDAWSLTSIFDEMPGRPPVAEYLHGCESYEPPRTEVAWREEVERVTGELIDLHPPDDLQEAFPLKPHELLSDSTDRVFRELEKIANRNPISRHTGGPIEVWLVKPTDEINRVLLSDLVARNYQKKPVRNLANCTIILPPSAGGLHEGMLDGDAPFVQGEVAYDIANDWWYDKDAGLRRRYRLFDGEAEPAGDVKMRLVRSIELKVIETDPDDADNQGTLLWRWLIRPNSADDDASKTAREKILYHDHVADVERQAMQIVELLPQIDEVVRSAVLLSAKFHDLGKRRVLWQRSIGNFEYDPDNLWAKSGNRRLPAMRTDYRHEFGSLVDAAVENEFRNSSHEVQDLVLHLIAAHHGRSRPHFPSHEAFDPERDGRDSASIASEVPKRFARLQRKYGRWGLAYIESLLRAADAEASANPSFPEVITQ